jgi:hypothetical protein
LAAWTEVKTPQATKFAIQLSIQCVPQWTPKPPSSEPQGAIRQQAIAKTPAKRSVLPDSKCNCLICSLVFRVMFVSPFSTSYNRLSAYQLQKRANEPSFIGNCLNFCTICK